MGMIIREFRECEYTGEIYYIEPPEAGLPCELWDYSEELCKMCNEYKLPAGHIRKKVNGVLLFIAKHIFRVPRCCGKK